MRLTKIHDKRGPRTDQADPGHAGRHFRRHNGVVRAGSVDPQDTPATSPSSSVIKLFAPTKLVAVGAALWVLGAMIYLSVAYAQAPSPTLGPAASPDAFAGWAMKIYKAAQQGEWRTVFSALLIGAVGIIRWATKMWRAELEAKPWYREVALPLLPVIMAVFTSVGVDLAAGKPVGMSFWRGINVGLMAGGGYKLWQTLMVGYKKLKPPTIVVMPVLLLLLLTTACARGYAIRAVGFEKAHRECAEKGWAWAALEDEKGPHRSPDGIVSGEVSVIYECTPPK